MDIKDEDYLVCQSNEFITGKRNLGLLEQKVFYTLVSKIKPEDDDFKIYSFNISKLSEDINCKYEGLRTMIRSSVTNLSNLKAVTNNDNTLEVIPVFGVLRYKKNKGEIEIGLNPYIKPFLLKLKKNFTKYYLSNVIVLNSKYAIRLYNLLRMNLYKGVVVHTISDFKSLINCPYDRTNDIKNKVIEVSIKEINSKTDLFVEYELIKKGRKIEMIKFKISEINKEQELYSKK